FQPGAPVQPPDWPRFGSPAPPAAPPHHTSAALPRASAHRNRCSFFPFSKAVSFSRKNCRARNTRERTAASLTLSVAAISAVDISSNVERTRGSRNLAGKWLIKDCTRLAICVLNNSSSALTLHRSSLKPSLTSAKLTSEDLLLFSTATRQAILAS